MREEEFGFLLYDRRSDVLYQGNSIGLEVLRLLAQGVPRGEIRKRICSRYRVGREEARRDVNAFVRFFQAEGLLRS